jgi:hypothetical protein
VLGPQAFAAAGAPWTPHEWVLGLALAFASLHGAFGALAVITAAAAAGAVAITALAALRSGASSIAAIFCALCAGLAFLPSYGVRAQVFAWFFAAALLCIARTAQGRTLFAVVPLTLIWANIHASAVLAPVLLGACGLGALFEKRVLTARALAFAAAGSAAAVLATPFGVRLPLLVLQLVHSPIVRGIVEWQRPTLHSEVLIAVLPLAALAVSRIAFERKWGGAPLCCLAVMLGLSAVRNLPLSALILAPLAAGGLTRFVPEYPRVAQLLRDRAYAGVLCACSIVAGLTAAHAVSFPVLPARAVDYAAALSGTHRLLCEDWSWCALVLTHPSLSAFVDGRCDAYPLDVWNDEYTVAAVQPHWRAVLMRHGIDLVLVRWRSPLAAQLRASGWKAGYRDAVYALFVRSQRAAKPSRTASAPHASIFVRRSASVGCASCVQT